MRAGPVLVLIAAATVLPRPAAAHQASTTFARLDASADRRAVSYRLEIGAGDLAEALGVTGVPDDAALRAGAAAIEAYVAARVDLAAPGRACPVERAPLELGGREERAVVLRWTLTCPTPIDAIALDYALFFDLDPGHLGLVTVDGEPVRLRDGDARLEWTLVERPDALAGFVASGVHHILSGLDHLGFLLALLLVAVVRAGPDGRVERRRPREALVGTAAIVTAFTLAHSVTLIAAALGWVALPARLVESLIAGSIVVVALAAALRPAGRGRPQVAFGFGLLHGLGFAAMLAPLLPPTGVVAPLLAFNVGVELGQLLVVAAVLPVLYLLAGRLGPRAYHRRVVVPVAVGLAGLGLIWLVERAFAIPLLGLGG